MARKKVVKTDKSEPFLKSSLCPKAIVAMTLAISGFVLLLLSTPLSSIIFFIAALIFAIASYRIKKTRMGKTSIILSIIGIVLSIIWWYVLIKFVVPYITRVAGL